MKIDGQDTKELTASSIKKNVSFVSKNGLLLNNSTIYENIIYENPEVDLR